MGARSTNAGFWTVRRKTDKTLAMAYRKNSDLAHPERWVKTCSECGTTRKFNDYKNWWAAKQSKLCHSCNLKLRSNDSYNGVPYGDLTRVCKNCKRKICYLRRQDFRQAVDRKSFCSNCRCVRSKGVPRSHSIRLKLRRATADHHAQYGPGVDVGASEFFNSMNLYNGFHIQHPNVHFPKLGYFADGYDPNLHAWFEFDTPCHRWSKYRSKDSKRQSKIISHFNRIGNPLIHFFRVNRTGAGSSGMIDILAINGGKDLSPRV